jgi:hypothetical protein
VNVCRRSEIGADSTATNFEPFRDAFAYIRRIARLWQADADAAANDFRSFSANMW